MSYPRTKKTTRPYRLIFEGYSHCASTFATLQGAMDSVAGESWTIHYREPGTRKDTLVATAKDGVLVAAVAAIAKGEPK